MKSLSRAIAEDIKKAHEEHLVQQAIENPENGDGEINFLNDIAEALENTLTACEPGAQGEPYHLDVVEEEDFEDEEDEADVLDDTPNEYEVYMEVYQYVIGMAGYLVNQEALLETYPVLRQYRMFLHGAVLDSQPDHPESTVSQSYFNFWSTFDCRIGNTGETLGLVVRETIIELEQADASTMHFLDLANASRMGIYVHCGFDEGNMILEELGSATQMMAQTPWDDDYQGRSGELWFVRILPPLGSSACHVMVTTPYILQSECRDDFMELIDGMTNFYDFMKYGPTPHYWLDYLTKVPSMVDEDRGVIFLEHAPSAG